MVDGAALQRWVDTWICIWLLENGAPLTSFSFDCVLQVGNVQVMEWCLHNRAVFNDKTFYMASCKNKIEVLEWLKLNDCPWGVLSLQLPRNVDIAKSNVLNWLKENGCPEN